jgi:hypothetical protein
LNLELNPNTMPFSAYAICDFAKKHSLAGLPATSVFPMKSRLF